MFWDLKVNFSIAKKIQMLCIIVSISHYRIQVPGSGIVLHGGPTSQQVAALTGAEPDGPASPYGTLSAFNPAEEIFAVPDHGRASRTSVRSRVMMSSLYIGATGMKGLGEGMQVITDNLANENTVGFKYSMMLYQNLMSEGVSTPSNFNTNMSQCGMGLSIMDARVAFYKQGAFESSNTVTDIGINGTGFFGVMKGNQMHYTRAGNFRFDKEGNLLDPNDYALMARPIVNGVVQGGAEPVKLDFSSDSSIMVNPGKATGGIHLASNLGGVRDMSENAANPMFAMTARWNGTNSNPLGGGEYGYTDPLTVYDANGDPHTLNVYYDYVGERNGMKIYEYAVGMDPAADGSANGGTRAAGLLMSGTITFSSNGHIAGMTAFTPTGSDPSDLSAWTPANLNADGVPEFTATFAGAPAQTMSLNLGLKMPAWPAGMTNPAQAAANPEIFSSPIDGATREQYSFTAQGNSTVNTWMNQDGYPVGDLQNLAINQEGVIQAQFSNGQTVDLYKISMYRFISQEGLRAEGNNHYSATMESGAAQEGFAKEENFGSIYSNNLEMSNVDMATEFTNLIITQRGFQINSKVVTTSDTMLQKALELKRS